MPSQRTASPSVDNTQHLPQPNPAGRPCGQPAADDCDDRERDSGGRDDGEGNDRDRPRWDRRKRVEVRITIAAPTKPVAAPTASPPKSSTASSNTSERRMVASCRPIRSESAIETIRERCRAWRYTIATINTRISATTPRTSRIKNVSMAALMNGMSATSSAVTVR